MMCCARPPVLATAIVCVLTAMFAAPPATATDPRVKEAESLAAHGEVDAARAHYQAIFDELSKSGAESSPALHYNLGTLALAEEAPDDIGVAVLHLMAAARRAPFDDDIRHNLDVALGLRADQVTSGSSLAPGARLPAGPVRFALGIALALLGLALAVRGLGGPRVAAVAGRLVVPLIAIVVVAAVLFALRFQADRTDIAVVMKQTEALPQPDVTAKGFTVHPGLSGVVVAEQQGFLRLRLENGIDVWVERGAVAVVP